MRSVDDWRSDSALSAVRIAREYIEYKMTWKSLLPAPASLAIYHSEISYPRVAREKKLRE